MRAEPAGVSLHLNERQSQCVPVTPDLFITHTHTHTLSDQTWL